MGMLYYEQFLFAGKVITDIKKRYVKTKDGEKLLMIDFRILKTNGKYPNGEWKKSTFICVKAFGGIAMWFVQKVRKDDNVFIEAVFNDGAWQQEDGKWTVYPHFIMKYCKLIGNSHRNEIEFHQPIEENISDYDTLDLKNEDVPF